MLGEGEGVGVGGRTRHNATRVLDYGGERPPLFGFGDSDGHSFKIHSARRGATGACDVPWTTECVLHFRRRRSSHRLRWSTKAASEHRLGPTSKLRRRVASVSGAQNASSRAADLTYVVWPAKIRVGIKIKVCLYMRSCKENAP